MKEKKVQFLFPYVFFLCYQVVTFEDMPINCEHSLPLWFCPQRGRDFRHPLGHYYVGFSFVVSVKQLSVGVQNDWIASLLNHVGLCQISPPWLCTSRGQPGQPAYENTTTPPLFSFSNKEGCYS